MRDVGNGLHCMLSPGRRCERLANKVRMRRSSIIGFLVAVVCVTAACARGGGAAGASASPNAQRTTAPDNGRLIFQTGRDSDGKQIVAAKPPLRSSCAACHGANGAGGVHLPGGAVSADLRHNALVLGQKHPYTLALLERAITTGVDNEGQPLNPVMPHWRLSHRDLHDVASYVLTQLK
jgi:mono/diheme cytochrome c family protein